MRSQAVGRAGRMTTPQALILLITLVLGESRILLTQREINREWLNWKIQYQPDYESRRDEDHRRSIFARNLLYIRGQNRRFKAGLESYATGLNQFADLTVKEFTDKFLGTKPRYIVDGKPAKPWKSSTALRDLPDTVDWRDHNLVTEVKNQVSRVLHLFCQFYSTIFFLNFTVSSANSTCNKNFFQRWKEVRNFWMLMLMKALKILSTLFAVTGSSVSETNIFNIKAQSFRFFSQTHRLTTKSHLNEADTTVSWITKWAIRE